MRVLFLCLSIKYSTRTIFSGSKRNDSRENEIKMKSISKTLEIRTSPHINSAVTTDIIMRNVVFALFPIVVFSIYAFGLAALLVISVATISCVFTEYLICRLTKSDSTLNDWSAIITGLLFGLTLPPGFPLWMVATGGFIAIGLGKVLFGGLGFNTFNPALVGRAFLQAAFPVAITTWHPAFLADRFINLPSSTLALPFMQPGLDAVTGATPLGALKFDDQGTEIYNLAFGFTGGSVGETCAILILIGGIYLAFRKMLDWKIPIVIFITVSAFSGTLHLIDPQEYPSAVFMLFSGGLMLGAVFMATDMVSSPMTTRGVFVYGILIGVLVVVIRIWGGLPEGVMYAILFANGCTPLINWISQPRVYGTKKKVV